jgi:hypothetical protein
MSVLAGAQRHHYVIEDEPTRALTQGLALERNLFLKLCITEPALARMRSYEEKNVTAPSRSIVA